MTAVPVRSAMICGCGKLGAAVRWALLQKSTPVTRERDSETVLANRGGFDALLRHIAGVPRNRAEMRQVLRVIQSRGQLRRIGASIGDEPYCPLRRLMANFQRWRDRGLQTVDLSALSARISMLLVLEISEHKFWVTQSSAIHAALRNVFSVRKSHWEGTLPVELL